MWIARVLWHGSPVGAMAERSALGLGARQYGRSSLHGLRWRQGQLRLWKRRQDSSCLVHRWDLRPIPQYWKLVNRVGTIGRLVVGPVNKCARRSCQSLGEVL